MESITSGIFYTSLLNIFFYLSGICSDTCSLISNGRNGQQKDAFLMLISTNGTMHVIPFGDNENQRYNISCNISALPLPADFCFTTTLSAQHSSAALQTTPAMTRSTESEYLFDQSNDATKLSSTLHTIPAVTTSTRSGYMNDQSNGSRSKSPETPYPKDLFNKTLYGSSFGAAFAGLVVGIMITSIFCLLRDRNQKQKTRAMSQVLYTINSAHNPNEPPTEDVPMSGIYNEINEENKSKVVQVLPMMREQPQSSMKSKLSFGVYNHLHESPVTDRDDNYDHAHFTGNEVDPDPAHYGTIETASHPIAKRNNAEVVDDNHFLKQSENLSTQEIDENKVNQNYFVLEKI